MSLDGMFKVFGFFSVSSLCGQSSMRRQPPPVLLSLCAFGFGRFAWLDALGNGLFARGSRLERRLTVCIVDVD